jgi:MFS family permease
LLSGAVIGAFYGLAPLFTQQQGLDTDGTARFMALTILGGTLLQWPLGKLSDHVDRRVVLLGVAAGVGIAGFGLLLLGKGGETVLLLSAPLLGGMLFTLYPLSVSHVMDRVGPGEMVAASGAMVTVYGFGAILGPLGGALAMALLGADGLFAFIAAMGLATALFGAWRLKVRGSVPADAQGAFQLLPRTTPLVSSLDPRCAAEAHPEAAAPGPGLAR